jgi:hypothetical protein
MGLTRLAILILACLLSAAAADAVRLETVLDRAASYVEEYQRAFSAAVAEERYEQAVIVPPGEDPRKPPATWRVVERRTLRSDFLLVRPSGSGDWLPFRDVFEVNAVSVRDREERLQRLFLESPATAVDQAGRITIESARYNIGMIQRTVNVPTLPLRFLQRAERHRFAFRKRAVEPAEGVQAWRIDYTEKTRPTIIRAPVSGRDVPASGQFWIEPASGRIVRTALKAEGWGVTMEATVVYRPDERLGLWVPAEMRERYPYSSGASAGVITGAATYTNFRRFTVTTSEEIKRQTATTTRRERR